MLFELDVRSLLKFFVQEPRSCGSGLCAMSGELDHELDRKIVVGVQSGRAFNECVQLLRLHGFEGPEYVDTSPRCLRFKAGKAPSALGACPVQYVLVKPRDVPHWLQQGVIDIAACFDDSLQHLTEKNYSLKPLREFTSATGPEFAVKARLAICGRPGVSLEDPQNRIIAEYEDAERLMRKNGIAGSVFFASGGSEGAISAGIADLGLMIVQTGSTLKANGLAVLKDLGEIKLNLWCNTERPQGLHIFSKLGMEAARFVRICGPDHNANQRVVDLLKGRKEMWPFVICAVGPEVMQMPAELGSFAFVIDASLAPGLREEFRTWAAKTAVDVLEVLLGEVALTERICARVLADAAEDEPARADKLAAEVGGVDIETLTDAEFARLPLVIKGESKEIRYAGKGLVVIRFLPTIYSYTQNRAAEVAGSDKLRLRADQIFINLFRAAGINHAYLRVTDRWVLARLVMPHAVEFAKYGLPVFVPADLTEAEIRALPRAPPIEIIIKTFHGGTSKHRYRSMQNSPVRSSHPLFSKLKIETEAPYPAPLVRFDWRNPLTMKNDPLLKAGDEGRQAACTAFLDQLPEFKDRFGSSFDYMEVQEFFTTSIDPSSKRVPDEILPEPLADFFIDVANARQTALNLYHVMQTFLDTCDIVCNDLCLFITEDGSMCYGEISQDCGRFRHFDLGSLDKDVWRAGGSSDAVLEKWSELARLLEVGWSRGLPREIAVPKLGTAAGVELFIGTSNPYKLAEISAMLQHLDIRITPTRPDDIPEPYDTFRDNARTKALAYAATTGSLTLAEDSGISINALGGLPGPWSARFSDFAEVDVTKGIKGGLTGYTDSGRSREDIDAANTLRVLELMEGKTDRAASFHIALCLARPGKVIYEVEAESRGTISLELRGQNGFGYDPVFVGEDTNDLTFAELDPFRKNLRSHRRKALKTFARYMVDQIIK